jgi:hypothetical protein
MGTWGSTLHQDDEAQDGHIFVATMSIGRAAI